MMMGEDHWTAVAAVVEYCYLVSILTMSECMDELLSPALCDSRSCVADRLSS